MQTFGTLSPVRFINDKVVATELRRVIRDFSVDVQVVYLDKFINVKFGRLPTYLLDPIVCNNLD